MASVEIRGLRELTERFDHLPQALKRARRDAVEQAGQKALSAVRGRIGGQGKVQRWQEDHLGSGWGYAAARPRAGQYTSTRQGTRYAVGYVTNAIENGHFVRQSASPDRRAERMSGVSAVRGKYMYQNSAGDAARAAQEAGALLERRFREALE